MSSFGENELLVGSRIVGRVRVLDLSAGSAIFPRLVLRLGVTLHDNPKSEFGPDRPIEAFEMRDMRGELKLQESGMAVGFLHWAGHRRFVRSTPYGGETGVDLVCDLDPVRIEKIEAHRAGREAIFWLTLWPTLVDRQGFLDSDANAIRATIPRDKWLDVLGLLTDARIALLEVRRPHLEAPEFDASLGHLKEARTRVDHGDYDESVACCRRAIESLAKALDVGHEAADLEKTLGAVSDEERGRAYAGIVSRLKQLANLAIHRPEAPGRYSRVEAQFVVGTTEHALVLLAALLKKS